MPTDSAVTVAGVIDSTWEITEPIAHLKALTEGGQRLAAAFIKTGDHHAELLQNPQSLPAGTLLQEAYIVTYFWSERAKSFLILWRDILFEQQKAVVLLQQGQITETAVSALRTHSEEVVRQAAAELDQFVAEKTQKDRHQRGGLQRQIERLRLQHNPWPVYREQLQMLSGQMSSLLELSDEVLAAGQSFIRLQALINERVNQAIHLIQTNQAIAQQAIDRIEEEPAEKPGKLVVYLEDTEENLPAPASLQEFMGQLESLSAELPEKLQVPVATEAGWLQYKEINFHKSVQQWLESEIMPLVYEIWEVIEIGANGLKMSLLNIRNRASLLATEQKEGKTPDLTSADFSQPLQAYIKKAEATFAELTQLKAMIGQRLTEQFNLATVYSPTQAFLPVTLQSTIKQLRVNQNAILTSIQAWALRQTRAVRKIRQTVEREEALSTSEKVVRYLQSRTPGSSSSHYNSIFLTKGYIGESFWVGRQDELSHLRKLIEDWRMGYRGAVTLSGQRFSGKSLLGDLIANRFFPKNTIRLVPQSTLSLHGRRLDVTYDLEEALSFVRKNTLNTPSLVWIDDLELWRDPNIPLGKNISALRRYIDQYGNQLFFLVSLSNWLQAHLDRFYEINKVFQADINLDRMPLRHIREAIMIRHGATHKLLVDAKGREVSPQQFNQMTIRVYRQAHGNIGEALNLWAYSTQTLDEERVQHQLGSLPELPDFLNPDNALLLTSITLAKMTNEYRLRKLFGPAFVDQYRGALQRLINIGLLHRGLDGWLTLNYVAANDVARLLQRKHYIDS